MEPAPVAANSAPDIVAAPVTGAAAPADSLLFVPAAIGATPPPVVELETKAKNEPALVAAPTAAPAPNPPEPLPHLDPLTTSREGIFALIRELGGDEKKQQLAADLIRSLLTHGAATAPAPTGETPAPNARVERRLTMLPEHTKPAVQAPVFDVKGTDYFSS